MSKNENLNPIQQEEERNENVLRPNYLKDFLGQEKLKSNLEIFIRAAKNADRSDIAFDIWDFVQGAFDVVAHLICRFHAI